jgi:pimeloyl-ACP methyl ester carboxylesterase
MTRLFRLDILLMIVVPLAVAVGAQTGNFAGLIDIGGGRKMYLKCSGKGSPTVVFVGGLRASADDWDISDKSKPTVFTRVGKFTRVCACDRPGTPVGEET